MDKAIDTHAPADGLEPEAVPPGILLVDDEANILTSLRRLLRPEGYRIHTAGGGAEGLEILERERIDLVISDMRMPEMDGAAFLAEVYRRWPGVVRILLTGFADLQSAIAAVNAGRIYQYLSKPWQDDELKLAVHNGLERRRLEEDRRRLLELTRQQNKQLAALNGALEQKVKERTRELRRTLELLEQAHENLKRGYVSSLKVFSNMIEMREGSMAGHSRRVASMARELALRMGMNEEQAQHVLFAGLLHDVGKLGLNDEQLRTPFNELTPEQRQRVIKHPIIGQGLLMTLEPLQEAAQLIRSHHERYDGQGYPDGLRGDAIPLGARILALVNDFDAAQIGALSSRCLNPREALDFILENRGKRYEPAVVDAFAGFIHNRANELRDVPGVLVKPEDLAVGMILARDLITPDGLLILAEGHLLDGRLIRRIQGFERSLDEQLVIHVRRRPGEPG